MWIIDSGHSSASFLLFDICLEYGKQMLTRNMHYDDNVYDYINLLRLSDRLINSTLLMSAELN